MTVLSRPMLLGVAAIAAVTCLYAASSNQHTKTFKFLTFQGSGVDGTEVSGSSVKLTRSEDSIWIRVNTTQLPMGAYTNWWVIFNNPAACSGGCGMDDFPNPMVGASVFFATGGVVGQTGVGHFDAHVDEGDISAIPGQHLFGPGLTNAQAAEVHYVIRYHGPLVPAIADRQLTTFAGGCSGPVGEEDPVPADRIYPCYDPQAAVIPAP